MTELEALVERNKDRFPDVAIAYEITMPDGTLHTLAGPWRESDARRLWLQCADSDRARFVAIFPNGTEYGTKRPYEFQGKHGFFEVCGDCGREFKAERVGDAICHGCELVNACVREEYFS